ncbi:MAG: ubiquinone/menaquinone biosynthesis methyltransferase [Planctomycetota bacterium]
MTRTPIRPERDVFTMFDSLAGVYDLLNRIISLYCDVHWRRHLARMCIRRGDERVLDVCCGTGDLVIECAREMDERGIVCGLDFSPAMLAVMRKKLAVRRLRPGIISKEGSAQCLPFGDDSFDVVVSAFGVRNISDPGAALAEMARVLKTGGVVGILEFVRPDRATRAARFYLRRIIPLVGRMILRTRDNPYQYLADSVEGFLSAEELKDKLCAAGLKNVKYEGHWTHLIAFHTATK